MSKKRVTPVDRSNGYHKKEMIRKDRRRPDDATITDDQRHIRRRDVTQKKPDDQENKVSKEPEKDIVEVLSELIDKDAARIGLVIANVYKALTMACASLPDMELDTELMHLCVHEDGICVEIFHGDQVADSDDFSDSCEDCGGCNGGSFDCRDEFDEYDDYNDYDEEEEKIYDFGD